MLARLMGSSDRDAALGRMIRVWMECIERETYWVPFFLVETIFDSADAPKWLVDSDLAEPIKDGLRIKGTEGRIEYLALKRANARQNGKLGGRPKTKKPVTDVGSASVIVETHVGSQNNQCQGAGAGAGAGENSLGLGMQGEGEPAEPAALLTVEFLNAPYRGPRLELRRLHDDCRNAFTELLAKDISAEQIITEIKRADRPRTEFVHEMTKRLLKQLKGIGNAKPTERRSKRFTG